MAEERSGGIGEGIRTGIGILTAFKEAIEETIEDAAARGDLSPDRARVVMRQAAERVQESLEEARDRFEFVPRREYLSLRAEVDALKGRVAALEARERIASQPSRSDASTPSSTGESTSPFGSIPVD